MTVQPALRALDAAALARVAALHDEVGVLTVIAARDGQAAEEIETVLRRHRDDFPLGDLEAEAVALCDRRLAGPAHALVAPLSGGAVERLALPAPAPTSVLIAPGADLEPLARALDDARPIGVIDVRREGVRVVECAAHPEEVAEIEFALEGDWTELRGSARANPLRATESVPQRERYEHRLDAQRVRELARADRELATLAHRRGWAAVLVAGDAELAAAVADELPGAVRIERRLPAWESAGALAHALRAELAGARHAVARALIDAADARPAGFAAGPHAVAAAIAAGRVRDVVVDAATLGDALEVVLRPALAAGLTVRFADGALGARHGALGVLGGAAPG